MESPLQKVACLLVERVVGRRPLIGLFRVWCRTTGEWKWSSDPVLPVAMSATAGDLQRLTRKEFYERMMPIAALAEEKAAANVATSEIGTRVDGAAGDGPN